MRRRAFGILIGSLATTPAMRPSPVSAQQGDSVRRLGILLPYAESDAESRSNLAVLSKELTRLGWNEGRNLRIDVRWSGGDSAKVPFLAREIVADRPDVILSRSLQATAALARETRTIPIIFVVVSDPVGDGLVDSFARPGRNVTGFTNVEASLCGKWLQLLKEIKPGITRVAVVYGPATAASGGAYYLRLAEEAAATLALKIVATPIRDGAEIGDAISAFAGAGGGGLLVTPDATTTLHRAAIFAAAARHKLPAVYAFRYFTAEGGLASYGTDVEDLYRRASTYVDRVLRGAKPNDLPVQAPVKFDMAINLKTAKALGLTIPPSLLARADEIIE